MTLRREIIKLAYRSPGLRDDLLYLVAKREELRPPKWIVIAVAEGKLPTKVLAIWKYVVENLGHRFNYGAGIVYWRNKCKKMGIDLGEYMETGGGPGSQSVGLRNFPIKTGDDIEKWVEARLQNEGLIAEVQDTAHEVAMRVDSIEGQITRTQERIEKHRQAIREKGLNPQRERWLAKAEDELEKLKDELEQARGGVNAVAAAAERHEEHEAPSIDFEKEFKKLIMQAGKELSQQQIMDQVLRSLTQFNATLAQEPVETARVAGVMDFISRALSGAWKKLTGFFKRIIGWAKGLFQSANNLNKLLDAAGA